MRRQEDGTIKDQNVLYWRLKADVSWVVMTSVLEADVRKPCWEGQESGRMPDGIQCIIKTDL